MNNYYQDIITQKSWNRLMELQKEVDFILIGGWAVYLWTHALKSKDIDIVINYESLAKLKSSYPMYKNDRLKKYEIKKGGIDIDIYVPFYSVFPIPVHELSLYAVTKDRFTVLQKEALLVLKINAYEERKLSIKGQKDKIDLLSLLMQPDFDIAFFQRILTKYQLNHYSAHINRMIKETTHVKELDVNQHKFARIKKHLLQNLLSAGV